MDMTTEIVPVNEDVIVFNTKKLLNERFTPQFRRCVFVINNGYTASFKENKVKDKMVIRSRAQINTNNRFSMYTKYCEGSSEEQIEKNEPETQLKEPLNQEVKKRRVVLLPSKKKHDEQPTDCENDQPKKLTVFETNDGIALEDPNSDEKVNSYQAYELDNFRSPTSSRNVRRSSRFQNRLPEFKASRSTRNYRNNFDESEPRIYSMQTRNYWNSFDESKPRTYSKQDNFRSPAYRRSIWSPKRLQNRPRHFRAFRSTYNYRYNYDESEPIIYSPFRHKDNENYLQPLYKWSRAPTITKEDLDRELDNYMDEVNFKPQPTIEEDNTDSFVQEFKLESNKYLYGEEEYEEIDMTY